jgi:hypothetical protein
VAAAQQKDRKLKQNFSENGSKSPIRGGVSFGFRQFVFSPDNIKHINYNFMCCILVPSIIYLQVKANDRRPSSRGGGTENAGLRKRK